MKVYVTGPWSKDCREYGCPIEVNIHTAKYHRLWRPFSKSQAYDWNTGHWSGGYALGERDGWQLNPHKIVWKHWVKSPQRPEIWERL